MLVPCLHRLVRAFVPDSPFLADAVVPTMDRRRVGDISFPWECVWTWCPYCFRSQKGDGQPRLCVSSDPAIGGDGWSLGVRRERSSRP